MSTNINKILEDLNAALKNPTNGPTSKGIVDTATREQMLVNDSGVTVSTLKVGKFAGPLSAHTAEINNLVSTNTAEFNDINVSGKLTANLLHVKRLISDYSEDTYTKPVTFMSNDPRDLSGKGFLWHTADMTHQLVFKWEERQIFSSESINLYKGSKYKIGGIDVIEADRLGSNIRYSNLKQVGNLENLNVVGSASFGETVFVNPGLGRLGINTDQPNAALGIVDGLVEVIIGADENNIAFIGTHSNHKLNLITDGTPRISIHGTSVEIGNAVSKNSVVKIFGTLEVDSIVSETRVEKSGPVEFFADDRNGIYQKGLLWKDTSALRKFFLLDNPDRFFSSETIDLSGNKNYSIGGQSVLSSSTLGNTVKESSLTKLGVLSTLDVDGDVNLSNVLRIQNKKVIADYEITVRNTNTTAALLGDSLLFEGVGFNIKNNGSSVISADQQGSISIGDKNLTNKNVKVYGSLSVNVTNPDPTVAFTVGGAVVLDGKKFASGDAAPTTGDWSKGDIMWNASPQETTYIGWVCTNSGKPGVWKPFGYIGGR
jgi:hypothetical protein